jgi:hypothetical protein
MSIQSAPRPSTAVTFRGGDGPGIEPIHVAPPGRGQVRVEIRATGVCHSDLHIVNGDWPADKPLVLGHEAAGPLADDSVPLQLRPTYRRHAPCLLSLPRQDSNL